MQARTMCERLLRQSRRPPCLAHAGTEGYKKLTIAGHLFNVMY